jgi:hypothetical protein
MLTAVRLLSRLRFTSAPYRTLRRLAGAVGMKKGGEPSPPLVGTAPVRRRAVEWAVSTPEPGTPECRPSSSIVRESGSLGSSSSARSTPWEAVGRWFKSGRPDYQNAFAEH